MASKWTVDPTAVERVTLNYKGEEFWLDLRTQLGVGDTKRLAATGIRQWTPSTDRAGVMDLNVAWDLVIFEKVKTWISDWSLTDDQAVKLSLHVDTLKAMPDDLFAILEKAVDEHAKKAPGTAGKSSTIPATPQP